MGKFNNFEDLRKAKLNSYHALKGSDDLGFLDQHTGFYPDPAHFIYELLQNAEDMQASQVTFRLYDDRLIFEHDGTKRDFNIEDIEAITSKGKSPKANEPTQIGKFGMGFKAVYVYTNTPEIHSGEFHFRIEHIIVPNNEKIAEPIWIQNTKQNRHTQFIFPFDNPNKVAQKAVEEITEGLCNLNETSLLFLKYIKTIRFYLPDDSEGYIAIEDKVFNIRFLYAITVRRPNLGKIITYWARFSDDCPIMVNDKGSNSKAVKSFPVSIAYKLNKSETDIFTLDSSLVGKVCLFFPTEMDSLLHFHINAPFTSTVARDVILSKGEDGEANEKLIRKLADLTAESLHWFKKAKMLDYAAYSTLPTLRDFNNQPNSRYRIFATRVKEEFENAELFITDNGKYCAINEIFNAANKDIKTILPIEYLEKLYQRSWIPTVSSVTRIEYFIDQFEIDQYSIEDFIDSLEKDSHFFDELLSEQQDIEYFKTLYYLLSQSKDREVSRFYNFFVNDQPTRTEILQNVSFFLCEDGKLHSIKDNLFLRTNYQPKHYLKNPVYVESSFKNTTQYRAIKQFLLSIGVKEMCEREDLIADVSGDNVSVDDMILKIMEIVEGYKSGTINIKDFANSPIFIATNGDGKIYKVKANECCWNESSSFFFKGTQYALAQEYYQRAGEDLPTLLLKEVFIKLGGKVDPIFEECLLCDDHPQFKSLKKSGVERETRTRKDFAIAEFYNFDELNLIKEKDLKDASLLLWNQVLKENDENKFQAVYRANYSVEPQYMESSLVYYLKRTEWIPTKSGEYKCPYELVEDDLLDSFKYEKPSLLLAIISVKPNDMVERLKSQGIEDENMLEFAQYSAEDQKAILALMQERKKKKGGTNITGIEGGDLDRPQSPEEDDNSGYDGYHKPKNIEKRKLKLEKEFDDRKDLPTSLKKIKFFLSKPYTEEKIFVGNQYRSRCQICLSEGIVTAKGNHYFEAINIFNTGKLDESLQIKLDLGWNTLCLCPNCAAKFKYSQLIISGIIEQVESIDISTVQSELIDISITLENKPTIIHFTHNHLLALQVAIKRIKEIENNEN